MIKSFHSGMCLIYADAVLGILFVMTKAGLTCGTTQNSNSICFYVFHERQKGADDRFFFF